MAYSVLIACALEIHYIQPPLYLQLTLSRPWVKKSWKIKRKAISKLVLSIMITYKRISVHLCVDLSVCNLLVFR